MNDKMRKIKHIETQTFDCLNTLMITNNLVKINNYTNNITFYLIIQQEIYKHDERRSKSQFSGVGNADVFFILIYLL